MTNCIEHRSHPIVIHTTMYIIRLRLCVSFCVFMGYSRQSNAVWRPARAMLMMMLMDGWLNVWYYVDGVVVWCLW